MYKRVGANTIQIFRNVRKNDLRGAPLREKSLLHHCKLLKMLLQQPILRRSLQNRSRKKKGPLRAKQFTRASLL